jgi:hypothetical protein
MVNARQERDSRKHLGPRLSTASLSTEPLGIGHQHSRAGPALHLLRRQAPLGDPLTYAGRGDAEHPGHRGLREGVPLRGGLALPAGQRGWPTCAALDFFSRAWEDCHQRKRGRDAVNVRPLGTTE